MAQSIKIELDTTKLDGLADEVRRNAQDILDVAARHIEATAKLLAPKDTGALANSIDVSAPDDLTRVIADGVAYGVYQEYGTSRQGAQPFMTPAVEAERRPLEEAWRGLINE